ncbi:MAG TPA: ATP phosphoribosyltransferase [Candidatus Aminicenantes bacterium]|nr:MAG: ATP phosphoribosyltransferase [Candidatus Aminicenantes bacterium]HEK85667.1 ATP phosphoribosyltransferase [Candidatus Aminicenantes bacterium]
MRKNQKSFKILIAKGRLLPALAKLLQETGLFQEINEQCYLPPCLDPQITAKLMKPQNIPELVALGSYDAGFTGLDWVVEKKAKVEPILDLGLNPVKLVSAVAKEISINELMNRKIIVASEYENITKAYLRTRGFKYHFIRTFGATEAFPPDDADLIVDNTATGKTLKQHGLKILDVIMFSSTRLIINPRLKTQPWKKEKLDKLIMLIKSVMNARERVMLEMNVSPTQLEELVRILPCMRAPTVSPLYNGTGYAVKVAVKKEEVSHLIPLLKKFGATDILEYELRKVII